jgi:hypothetical protein
MWRQKYCSFLGIKKALTRLSGFFPQLFQDFPDSLRLIQTCDYPMVKNRRRELLLRGQPGTEPLSPLLSVHSTEGSKESEEGAKDV